MNNQRKMQRRIKIAVLIVNIILIVFFPKVFITLCLINVGLMAVAYVAILYLKHSKADRVAKPKQRVIRQSREKEATVISFID